MCKSAIIIIWIKPTLTIASWDDELHSVKSVPHGKTSIMRKKNLQKAWKNVQKNDSTDKDKLYQHITSQQFAEMDKQG